MEKLLKKYADKLAAQGLCEEGEPLIGYLDAKVLWNRESSGLKILKEVINALNINSILFAKPAEPYFSILNYLSKNSTGNNSAIYPKDSETRTFLHDIPVSLKFDSKIITGALKKRKSIVISDYGIITFGMVSPEQAFVTYSSVCFAGFVKFFTDYLYAIRNKSVSKEQEAIFNKTIFFYKSIMQDKENFFLKKGIFRNKDKVIEAIIEAGRLTVEYRMVDSFFGNISYRLNNTIYISQTASSLDELAGCIDPCPLDNSSCAGITASSELSAHRDIYLGTSNKAILHGHPKFCVIMSLFCQEHDCNVKEFCHIKCPQRRLIKNIPIIPGEVGTGIHGLYRTLPAAIKENRGVIVYGHGLFTVGKKDFNDAFNNLMDIEKLCFKEYLRLAQ